MAPSRIAKTEAPMACHRWSMWYALCCEGN